MLIKISSDPVFESILLETQFQKLCCKVILCFITFLESNSIKKFLQNIDQQGFTILSVDVLIQK